MYLTGLNQLLFCILNPSIILWTTSEFRTIGKRLLLEKVVTPIMNNLIGSIEDHSVNQSINETIPTVSRRVQISTLATQQIAGINLIADEDANILGRRRPHFIDHDKPLNVSQVLCLSTFFVVLGYLSSILAHAMFRRRVRLRTIFFKTI